MFINYHSQSCTCNLKYQTIVELFLQAPYLHNSSFSKANQQNMTFYIKFQTCESIKINDTVLTFGQFLNVLREVFKDAFFHGDIIALEISYISIYMYNPHGEIFVTDRQTYMWQFFNFNDCLIKCNWSIVQTFIYFRAELIHSTLQTIGELVWLWISFKIWQVTTALITWKVKGTVLA